MKQILFIWVFLYATFCGAQSHELQELQFLDLSWQSHTLDHSLSDHLFLPQLRQQDSKYHPFGGWKVSSSIEHSMWAHNSKTTNLLQVSAVTNPLISHTRNTSASENSFAFLSWDGFVEYKNHLSLQWDLRLVADDLRENPFLPSLLFGSAHFRKVSVDIGKLPISWGASYEHRMLFSDAFDPFLSLRIRSNEAIDIPVFGKGRFEIIYGKMDEHRPRPNGYLIGMMFSLKPWKRLEFMFGQTVLYGGEGAPTQNPLVFYTERLITEDENPANRNIFLGLSYQIPKLEIQPYINAYGEDCCSPIVSKRNFQENFGVVFHKLDPKKRLRLNIERIRTNYITYRHNFAEYVQGGQVLGNPIGPDARGHYMHLFYTYSKALQFKLTLAHESRVHVGRAFKFNVNLPISDFVPAYERAEKRKRIVLSGQYKARNNLSYSFKLGLERVLHLGYKENNNDWSGLAQVSLRYRL